MPAKATFGFIDFDSEPSTVAVWATTLTAGNIVAQTGLGDDLRDAIDAVSIGSLVKDTRLASETKFALAPPVVVWAQRETKWHVSMVELGTGNKVSFEIPCADLTLLQSGTNKMLITAGAGLALVTAIEAYVLSNDGIAVTVQEIVHVGRSN